MTRFRKYFLCTLFIFSLHQAFAQDPEKEAAPKKFDPSRVFFGGSFGLSFGDYTLVNISPQVGYHFNKYFAAGGGLNFIYSSSKVRTYSNQTLYKQEYGYAGINIFGRAYPIQYLFVQAQPELNYSWGKIKYFNGQATDKLPGKFVPTILLGGGVAIPAGRGAFLISANYDVVQDNRSPYGNRVFINFGYNF